MKIVFKKTFQFTKTWKHDINYRLKTEINQLGTELSCVKFQSCLDSASQTTDVRSINMNE